MTSKISDVTLRDIMSREVVKVSPEASLREVLELLVGRAISGLPVTVGERVVGVISASDLLDFEFSKPAVAAGRPDPTDWRNEEPDANWPDGQEAPSDYFSNMWENVGADVLARFESADAPEWDALEEHMVAEVMTRAVRALPPETPVRDAARYMLQAKIHRVLVMQGEKLLGVVTTTDIVRAVAEAKI